MNKDVRRDTRMMNKDVRRLLWSKERARRLDVIVETQAYL